MDSSYNAYVVYGVMEMDRSQVLDSDWLNQQFPILDRFTTDIVHGTMGNAVYGVKCYTNFRSGVSWVENKDETEQVKSLYTCLSKGEKKYRIGWFTVISGDYKLDHKVYIPDNI